MYEIANLPKNPAIARQLLPFSQLGGLEVDQDFYTLAGKGLWQESDLNEFDQYVDLDVLQYIDDRKGRGIVIESKKKAFPTLLARVYLRDLFPLLVVATNSNKQKDLEKTVKTLFPNKAITGDVKELGKDIYVIQKADLYSEELLKKTRFKQVIIHCLDVKTHIRKLTDYVNVAHETFSVTIIVDARNLLNKDLEYPRPETTEMEKIDLGPSKFLRQLWSTVLYPKATFPRILDSEYERIDIHLSEKGYDISNRSLLLQTMNICPYLIE